MIEDVDIRNRKIWGQWLLSLFLPLVALGKVIRWTILRATTADMGIGHVMVGKIVNGDAHFLFSFQGGTAAGNANYFFSFFNLFNCTNYVEFEIGISIVFNIATFALMAWLVYRNDGLTRMQFLCLSLFIGVLNIYTFTLSKEAAQMIYYVMMFFVLASNMTNRCKEIWIVAIMLFMIFSTRFYLALMLAFAVGIRLVYPTLHRKLQGNPWWIMLIFLLAGAITYYLFLNYCKYSSPSDYLELIRVRTRTSVATTDIRTWIPVPNLEMFGLNYLITAVRMLFPVELLRFGPKYFVYVLFQLIVSGYMISGLIHYQEFPSTKQLVVCLYWGFFFCSVTFEPDFGSWVRHESVTFPILLFAFADNIYDEDEDSECETQNSEYV